MIDLHSVAVRLYPTQRGCLKVLISGKKTAPDGNRRPCYTRKTLFDGDGIDDVLSGGLRFLLIVSRKGDLHGQQLVVYFAQND